MTDLLSWITEYSPAVVLLLAALAALVFVLRTTVQKTIESTFASRQRDLALFMERRSAFRERILTERYSLISSLLGRLERVRTNLNRRRQGLPVPDGVFRGTDIVPLTELFEDLEIHRHVLGERYYELFAQLANLTLELANTSDWREPGVRLTALREEIRQLTDDDFDISNTTLRAR